MKTKLKNIEGKKQLLNLYFQKLNDLALEYELKTIESSYGDTNVIITGSSKNPPLILVHGLYSCAPLALESIVKLEKYFKIYAIDILGQPNLSEENSEVIKIGDHTKWMYEILSRLKIYNAYFIGISLGGFIGLKSLVFNSTRFKKAFLINPSGVVKFKKTSIVMKVLLPSLRYNFFKRDKHLKKIQRSIFTEVDLFYYNYLKTLLLFRKLISVSDTLISMKEANSITTPLYIIASEDGIIYSGKRLLQKSKKIFPSLEEVVLLPKVKHVLSKEQHQHIIDYILKTVKQ